MKRKGASKSWPSYDKSRVFLVGAGRGLARGNTSDNRCRANNCQCCTSCCQAAKACCCTNAHCRCETSCARGTSCACACTRASTCRSDDLCVCYRSQRESECCSSGKSFNAFHQISPKPIVVMGKSAHPIDERTPSFPVKMSRISLLGCQVDRALRRIGFASFDENASPHFIALALMTQAAANLLNYMIIFHSRRSAGLAVSDAPHHFPPLCQALLCRSKGIEAEKEQLYRLGTPETVTNS